MAHGSDVGESRRPPFLEYEAGKLVWPFAAVGHVALQLLYRPQYPFPYRTAVYVASLKHGVGALGRFRPDASMPHVLAEIAACDRRGRYSDPCQATYVDH